MPASASPEAPLATAKDDVALWSVRRLQALWSWGLRPSKPAYPPISSIPRTPAARLAAPDASPSPFPHEPVLARSRRRDAPAGRPGETVLYLAYGSNMCAETFLGMRGIRPLSQVNVSAPSLDLTFDLPGVPYREPCFANTAPRRVVPPGREPPGFPPEMPEQPPPPPPSLHPSGTDEEEKCPAQPGGPTWTKGLYGVVYEVTAEDYARIVATEGGGASYHEILVPCVPLPPSVREREPESEKPLVPAPPFLAHTLYAPRLPDTPDDDHDDDDDRDDEPGKTKKPRLPRWARRLLQPVRRPCADYAQPSARYLKLLRDGAREHGLPDEYQAYLGALQPYTPTTWRQRMGQTLFLGFWAPMVLAVMAGGRLFADERGRSPAWLVAVSTAVMNLVWVSYDWIGKPLFGDGERTVEEDGRTGVGLRGLAWTRNGFASEWRGMREVSDEEKKGLLDEFS